MNYSPFVQVASSAVSRVGAQLCAYMPPIYLIRKLYKQCTPRPNRTCAFQRIRLSPRSSTRRGMTGDEPVTILTDSTEIKNKRGRDYSSYYFLLPSSALEWGNESVS
uniref:Uncharacterized protein n=1 Tax=Juglanconis oblonga TaxID=1940568 RepID=A0A291LIA0_9PEZI|nr:hypothetical protein [Juglanconis oblonga]